MTSRVLQNLYLVGRLRPDVRLANAGATLSVIAHRLSAQYPETDRGMVLSVYSERFARPDPGTAGTLIKGAALFLALVVMVLLLACANIANLLLVRATTRRREMAVRAALGAARSRLIRQLLTESVLLAVIGGLAGLMLGLWGARAIGLINLHQPIEVPLFSGLDWRIFAYSLGTALFTGVLASLVPALQGSRTRLSATLHELERSVIAGKSGWRSALVAAQVTGSLMLLVIAGLLVRSLGAVQHVNLGFDPHHMMVLTMDPSEVGFGETQGIAFYDSLLERIRALPGVESAALTSSVPMSDFAENDYLKIWGYQNPPGQGLPLAFYGVVSPEFFNTMRIPILQGRPSNEADIEGAPYVAIVSEAFAKRFWPNQNPVAKHFAKVSGANNPLYEVIGVARDARFSGLSGPISAYFYLPLAQDYALSSLQTLAIRSSAPPHAVIREAEGIAHGLAPNLPLFNVQTMEESLDTFSGFLLFQMGAGLAALLGLLGLILAIVGVYGVISYSTAQRAHEIGIRVALGAQRSQILRLILGQGLLIVGSGLLAGCVGALAVARPIANLLVGVSPADPVTYIVVTSVLAVIALLACYVPARRATRVDPTVALRCE
jgi:macrolide transport system ATP-binding/permease protein